MILFQIKAFARNISETTLARYFIKVTARPSFTQLRVIRQFVLSPVYIHLFLLLIFTSLLKAVKFWLQFTLYILENVLNLTLRYFNTEFGPQRKDQKSTYQVRRILAFFLQLSCSNFRLKLC